MTNVKPDAFFGLVTIDDKTCGVCGAEPVAAHPIRMRPEDYERQLGTEALRRAQEETPEPQPDGAIVGVWWFCFDHAGEAAREGMPIQEISRTCRQNVGGSPCGAAATHMAILGVRGHGLQLLSVCPRHLRGHKPGED